MSENFPEQAQIVIIGGGIIGCSTAYHLAELGCRDVLLLEQHQLTAGSTWHAAGAVGQLRASANITRLLGHSVALYARIEAETGQPTGWVANGSLRLACTPERRAEYERAATTGRSFGLTLEMIGPAEVKRMVPPLEVGDILCAAFLPTDGVVNPSDLAMALARGARDRGVRIVERTRVNGFQIVGGRVAGVDTDKGHVRCETVVNCAGIWSRQVGRLAGVNVPIQPSHHQYLVTDLIPGLPRHIPTLRDVDNLTYFKEEVGGLAVGGYEPDPIPYTQAIAGDHEFLLMPESIEHFEPLLAAAVRRVPALETIGVKRWFNGIESFTEDGMFILGEAPELRGFFVGTGFNAFGIASAGGAGKALAQWILQGEPEMDLWAADIRRFGRYHGSDRQICARSLEGQSRHFTMAWPFLEPVAGRPLRRSALYGHLEARGACFGAKFGWERPNWFAPAGVEPVDAYTFGRANWFPHVGAEHRACREAAAVFDQSSFAKFAVLGPDAERVLQLLCCNDVGRPPGAVTYTQMLNRRGGIECDVTVSRISEQEFYIVTGTAFATHDLAHLRRNIPAEAHVSLMDVTSAYGCLAVMGPRSRDILSEISEGRLDNESFPFGTCREVFVAGAPVRMLRVTFVGELGWELHVPSEYLAAVYEALIDAGTPRGLRDAGYRAIDSLRLEKAYRVWAADIGPDYTPFEAGLGFCVALGKRIPFIGRDALLAGKDRPPTQRLAIFTHDDPDAILLGRETIYRDGERVGWLSSGGHGFTIGKDIGLGYVRNAAGVDRAFLETGRYELEIRTRRVPATIHLRPLYDPANARISA